MMTMMCLSGCSMLDNWLLGKDNTVPPTPLKSFKEQVNLTPKWRQVVTVRRARAEGFYNLRPIVLDNTVYTAAADGSVEARDNRTGKLLWRNHLNAALSSGPVVNQSYLVVGSEDASLFLLNRATGKLLWHKVLSNAILAAPALSTHFVLAKTIDSTLYAVDIKTGHIRWQHQESSPELVLRASSAPVVSGNIIVSGFANGKVYAFSHQGVPIWVEAIGYPKGSSEVERMIDVDATPIVVGRRVYAVSYQGMLMALSLDTSKVLWKRSLSSFRNMTRVRGTLYVTDSNSHIWAINEKNGVVLWHQKALSHRGVTAPVATPLGLLLADKFGVIHLLSYDNGLVIGRQKVTSDRIDSAPRVVGRAIYLQTARGVLHHLIEQPA